MDTGFDTSKIAYGSRPFIYQPPPVSIQATRWIGVLLVALSVWCALAALYAGYAFGLSQFALLIAIAAAILFVGVLTCAFGWMCKAQFDTLQIVAYRGKQG